MTRAVILLAVLAGCFSPVNPIGIWAARVQPGIGNCGIPTTVQAIKVSAPRNRYILNDGDPTFTGAIDCDSDRCLLDFHETAIGAQEHATWKADSDGKITGTGTVMVTQSSGPSCMQQLVFAGTLQ